MAHGPDGEFMSEGRRGFLAESSLIVISILIAFWVDAWWEDRQDRHEEQRVLEALKAEFQVNAEKLPLYINAHRQVANIVSKLLDGLNDSGAEGVFSLADHELAWILSHVSTDPQRGALDAILQSGELRFIQSRAIRERLAGWPQLVVDATENEDLLRNIWSPMLNQLLGEQLDVLPFLRAEECTSTPDYDPANCETKAMVEVRNDPRMTIALVQIEGWSREAVRELEVLREEALAMVQMIEGELDAGR